jgi:hypothetical protein
MGQVPVKVRGKVETGDYILASGLDDGFGIAVHPDEMKTDQYKRIVGVAWSASQGIAGFSYINTAVGIHTGELAAEITRQQAEIESVKANMNSIVSYLKAKDPGFDATIFETGKQVAPVPVMAVKDEKLAGRVETTNRLVTYLEERPEMLQQIMADARNSLDKRGIDYIKFEQTRRLVTDKSYFIDILKSSANN